jgi:hypothetical protein
LLFRISLPGFGGSQAEGRSVLVVVAGLAGVVGNLGWDPPEFLVIGVANSNKKSIDGIHVNNAAQGPWPAPWSDFEK